MFNESIQNNYRISYDEWYSEGRLATDALYQVDIGGAQPMNSAKYITCAHQTANRLNAPKKMKIFNSLTILM